MSRGERAHISNSVLNILTQATLTDVVYIASHVDLQYKLISKPSKSMCILTSMEEISGREKIASKQRNQPALLEIARKIDIFETNAAGPWIWADPFRRLCQSVMR